MRGQVEDHPEAPLKCVGLMSCLQGMEREYFRIPRGATRNTERDASSFCLPPPPFFSGQIVAALKISP